MNLTYFKKVSYEEFKLQFAQMYEHYERHRTDNITDPALRRAHPISTISGWDRDHDQSTDSSAKNNQLNDKAIANTRENESQNVPEQSFKVSKSEQTDDDDVVDLENVKCICEENANQDETSLSNNTDAAKEKAAPIPNANESSKPVQSISSISQVYNEQLTGQSIVCNGDSEHAYDDDTTSTPIKQVNSNADANMSGSDALRKTLEIDSYDMNEDNKEIVDEIVEEILTKSETLLDDCKRSMDDARLEETEATSSPVIKDEEIEHAVSEVVKGVRNIERKVKRDSENDTDLQNIGSDANINRDTQNDGPTITLNDETSVLQNENENQKTELVLSNAAIDEETKDILDDEIQDENSPEKTTTMTTMTPKIDTEEIKDIVTTIVNDVIENCVNQTATDNGDVCDNDVKKMSIIDNINNNSCDVATNDSNDNAIIVDTIAPTTDIMNATANETTPDETIPVVEETNEEIIKSIVNEIVDKCVESENAAIDNDNNNNNGDDDAAALNKAGNEAFTTGNMNETSNEAQITSEDSAKFTTIAEETPEMAIDNGDDSKLNDNRNTKLNRSQSTSISTSTQVENNHFGK